MDSRLPPTAEVRRKKVPGTGKSEQRKKKKSTKNIGVRVYLIIA